MNITISFKFNKTDGLDSEKALEVQKFRHFTKGILNVEENQPCKN